MKFGVKHYMTEVKQLTDAKVPSLVHQIFL